MALAQAQRLLGAAEEDSMETRVPGSEQSAAAFSLNQSLREAGVGTVVLDASVSVAGVIEVEAVGALIAAL